MKVINRIKANEDFVTTVRKGRTLKDSSYIVHYLTNKELNICRIGISVSKKVGNSVVRHHLARLIRESYRLHEEMFNSGLDIVVIGRTGSKGIGYETAKEAVLGLAKKSGVVIRENKAE